jgi:DNA-binding GntR family transcriptional regulator
VKSLVRQLTLREQALEAVFGMLKNGELAPGTRVTEEGLARILNVSRTPIREALGQLARQGVLMARARGGYVVPSPSVEQVRHIIAVRLLLEPAAVRMAAEEFDPAAVERVSRAIEAQRAAVRKAPAAAFASANEEFRHALFDSISNKALGTLIAHFDSHLHFIRAVTLRDRALRQDIVGRQLKIRDAIRKKDADRAERLWRAYLEFTEEVLVQALQAMDEPGGAAD